MSEEDKPTDWFESLYRDASVEGEGVPWTNMATHPSFAAWLETNSLQGSEKGALVVACGMGDDAIELESWGYQVTAFDVAESAIDHCKRRFPDSTVDFQTADLFDENKQWRHRFDFVLEIYTIQALLPKYAETLIPKIADFVAPGGRLLVVTVTGDKPRSFEDGPPWILTPDYVTEFESLGLEIVDRMVREAASKANNDVWVTTFERPA